ncbi:hypothetical protein Tco_1132831 [Tanacetum coccineum]|uniref:Uncharacterized protein n=1 Tax=Tanacetum coccineum TaxID=301880 RepID=A0ABQ5JEE7_9ASTR
MKVGMTQGTSLNRSRQSLPQDVPSTSERRLIELENQVQRLIEVHLAPKQPIQVNKIASSCEICSDPHDTQYCMEIPSKLFLSTRSYPMEDPQCSSCIHSLINAIMICPEEPNKSCDNKSDNKNRDAKFVLIHGKKVKKAFETKRLNCLKANGTLLCHKIHNLLDFIRKEVELKKGDEDRGAIGKVKKAFETNILSLKEASEIFPEGDADDIKSHDVNFVLIHGEKVKKAFETNRLLLVEAINIFHEGDADDIKSRDVNFVLIHGEKVKKAFETNRLLLVEAINIFHIMVAEIVSYPMVTTEIVTYAMVTVELVTNAMVAFLLELEEVNDLRLDHPVSKPKQCMISNGDCSFGDRCNGGFLLELEELKDLLLDHRVSKPKQSTIEFVIAENDVPAAGAALHFTGTVVFSRLTYISDVSSS